MRAFVALNPRPDVRRRLTRAIAPVRGLDLPVRWVDPAAVHLTLKFLGEVPERALPAIRYALEDAARGRPSVRLRIAGFGVFPERGTPRIVWAGIHPDRALLDLHAAVEERLSHEGYAPDGRVYRPHITLGRARRGARAAELAPLRIALAETRFEADVPVSSVDLMKSTLAPAGARYDRIDAVPLGVASVDAGVEASS